MEVQEVSAGAKFVRADLHIHSYGADTGSFDVKDTKMTPQNIVDTAIASDLQIISITDHNEIMNSKVAIEYAAEKNILVVPGIEVSTTQGHLLVYFKTFQDLRVFHGKLTISDDKERCSQGIVECLNLAELNNGFGILAHIELDSGFEKVVARFNAQMDDIFCHPALLALEICRKESADIYTDSDLDSNHISIIRRRRERLDEEEACTLPKVMSSDSHTLDKLGKNAEGNNKLTRFKVDELTFDALRISLMAHESRVRIEDNIPQRVPRFVSVKIKGGLLQDQIVNFSSNLTCIIGGRGTGKSTLMEVIRSASGNESEKDVIDSEVWPDDITLYYEDETGKVIEFRRSKNDYSFNNTDGDDGLLKVPIECYGQGETAETIQHSDEDPQSLLDFLDKFINAEHLQIEDRSICELLLKSQSEIGKLRIEVANIPDVERQLGVLKEKKTRLEKDRVGDLVKHQVALVKERSLREDLIEQLKSLAKSYREILKDTTIFDDFNDLPGDEIIVGKDQFSEVKRLVNEFSDIVSKKSDELNRELANKISLLNAQLSAWKSKESEIQKGIDDKKAELEQQGIPFDIGKINQIATDLEYYEKRLRKLNADKTRLVQLEKERTGLLSKRVAIKKQIYNERYKFSLLINDNLRNSVDGLYVSTEYDEGRYSPSFAAQLKEIMGWRTSQVNKSEIVAANMTPLEFSADMKAGRRNRLQALQDEEGRRVFSDEDVDSIIDRNQESYAYEDFESLVYEDRPHIKVTKIVEADGNRRHISRSIAQLSLGQQQSILLAILIQSRSTVPLLIDQPEDHLDSEFIYKTIVTNLKRIKERRQVIIVTHNANIAVLGDAELIIPLKSTNERSIVVNRGSIDRESIQRDCCALLEGGSRAFIKRQKIYNLDR